MPIVPAFGKWRQEDQDTAEGHFQLWGKFGDSMGYKRPFFKNKPTNDILQRTRKKNSSYLHKAIINSK